MAVTLRQTLRGLRNTRDLRAAVLDLASRVAEHGPSGSAPSRSAPHARLSVVDPNISDATIRTEWERYLHAFAPSVRERLNLSIEHSRSAAAARAYRVESGVLSLDRPNYRHEVLRLLLAVDLDAADPVPVKTLIDRIGASQTPIRQALTELKAAGLSDARSRMLRVAAEEISTELLARVGALPQTLRFRFERGARIKPAAALLERALPLLQPGGPAEWAGFGLSGVAVALRDVPDLDLLGLPRVDLVAHVPRDAKTFDAGLLRLLDDGLEHEASVLAPAPVVVTLVRGDSAQYRDMGRDRTRCASAADVFLSLLDMDLRVQALHYARSVRP